MPPSLFIRAPFTATAASTVSHFEVAIPSGDEFAITVTVDGTEPERLKLLPVFPGTLTFKPAATAAIPSDPTQAGAPAVLGNLYLELSREGIKELGKHAPTFGYRLVFAYLGITLNQSFFRDTVLKTLKRGTEYNPIIIGGSTIRRPSEAQLANAFARGELSVELKPTKANPMCSFPILLPDATTKKARVMLKLGALASSNPFVIPEELELTRRADDKIFVTPEFAPIPISFWFAAIRRLAGWNGVAAQDHANHPFFAALEAADSGNPPSRWRRLRMFPPGDQPPPQGQAKTTIPLKAFERATARALASAGSLLWESRLNWLGDIFVRREDGEDFHFEVKAEGVAVPLSLRPDGPFVNSIHLEWAPPAAGIPSSFDMTVDQKLIEDPLTTIPPVPLDLGAEDFRGLTIHRNRKAVLAERELVRPLQRALSNFGFGVTQGLTRKFDIPTRGAVREFQREASTHARVRGGAEVDPLTVTPFTGAPTGIADGATLREMLEWRTRGFRSPFTFHIVKGGRRTDDVGFASTAIEGSQVFESVGGLTGFIPRNEGKGLSNVAGTSPAVALNDPATAAAFLGAVWEKRAICAVAANEARVFEAINTWDDSFLSAGLFQWTLGNSTHPSELPGICSTLAPADFARLLGIWALETASVTGALNTDLLRGRFKLDGTVLTQDVKEEFRSFRWAYRFVIACRDAAFRVCQYNNALSRLKIMLGIKLSFGGAKITAAELLQSELLRAMALDHHVNRPAHVPRALQSCCDALQNPDRIIMLKADATTDAVRSMTSDWYETGRIYAFSGDWYEALYSTAVNKKQREKLKGQPRGGTVTLTDGELSEIDAAVKPRVMELVKLKLRCLDPTISDPAFNGLVADLGILPAEAAAITRAHTAALTVTGTTLATMTQDQLGALAELYRWQRMHVGTMTDPEGRWNRIVAGGYAGALGNPLTTPGVFTP